MFDTFIKNHKDKLYVLFRVIVGLLFAQHGAQKLLGWFGGNQAELFSLMGLAGTIELIGGLAIALGLFTRIIALIAGLEMLTAYFKTHIPQGWIPIMNKGELSLLFFAAFIILFIKGSKKWSLDALFKR